MRNQDGWDGFINLCLTAKTPEALSKIFEVFLTAEEREDIATRCQIVKELLAQNKTQRKISKDLGVSIAKITRGSNELKRQDVKLINYLKKIFST